jgi:hypothetical protein
MRNGLYYSPVQEIELALTCICVQGVAYLMLCGVVWCSASDTEPQVQGYERFNRTVNLSL